MVSLIGTKSKRPLDSFRSFSPTQWAGQTFGDSLFFYHGGKIAALSKPFAGLLSSKKRGDQKQLKRSCLLLLEERPHE